MFESTESIISLSLGMNLLKATSNLSPAIESPKLAEGLGHSIFYP